MYKKNMMFLSETNFLYFKQNYSYLIRKEEDLENSIIVNNIKSIIDLNDISNLDKLKLINNELGKILFDETI